MLDGAPKSYQFHAKWANCEPVVVSSNERQARSRTVKTPQSGNMVTIKAAEWIPATLQLSTRNVLNGNWAKSFVVICKISNHLDIHCANVVQD